ncbi:RND family transporter [Methanoplanus sp. FWC-SCC4]|uniref:RND family transporter n=1 Tax=Methanochimaera problematica TaxID=2609417 RepID=A0AA97FBE1_9EURY|nr:hydrophobe/amphiphile efflux-3 (HAE3) family transporter [Methanoplanus sp. FWC-SCC4]WOF15967.1 RND family transporter [Methanoplanus sp. FWC-SCC4]
MISPYKHLAEFIASKPKIVAAIIIVWFIISMYGMSQTHMKTGDDTYVDKTTPEGIVLEDYKDLFKSDAIMVIFESDDVLDKEYLKYMDTLMTDFSDEAGVKSVTSLADMVKSVNNGKLPKSQSDIINAKENIPTEILEKYLPSNMMTIGIISLDTGISDENKKTLLKNLETIISISNPTPDAKVTLSGTPAFQKQMGEEMGKSTGVLIMAAMLLMVVAVGLLFAHVSHRFLPVGIVFMGLINTFGIMGLTGISISMVVIAAFPVLIGIGIDYAIQFHSRLDEESKRQPNIEIAAKKTVENSGPSVLYAMIATSLGFIAMYISPIPMVVDFGMTCLIGVTCCYISAILIVPTYAILRRYKPKGELDEGLKKKMAAYDNLLGNVSHKIARYSVVVLLLLGLIAIVGVQLDNRVPISYDEETFVPPEMPAVVDMKKVTRTMGSTESLTIYVKGDDILNPEVIEWINDFGDYELSVHDELTSVTSISTLIKKYNGGLLPNTESEIKHIISMIPDNEKKSYLNGQMNSVIEFGMLDLEVDPTKSLVYNMRAELNWNYPPPGISAMLTGSTDLGINLVDDIANGKTQMTILGFILIFFWLILIYRRVSAISPLIPIIMIVGWNGAIMYVLGIDYTPMTAVLGSMTIGVASEYTILIMERYIEERKNGMNKYDAIRTGVQKIGTAITVSGMTTVFGFSALLLSTFNIIKNFGMVTVITVGFSLIGAIVVMPAILSLMSKFEKENEKGQLI